MRAAFKKAAEENTAILNKNLGEYLVGTWALARKSSDIIDSYIVRIRTEGKELDSIILLRNIISDLCCCLDALERGNERTILNNLRTAFEDYCCAVQIQYDPLAYALFLRDELNPTKSITFAKKLNEEHKDFGQLYGLFSNISHHSQKILLARQVVFIKDEFVCYAHLKPINPSNLKSQISALLFIAFLLIEIGVLTEKICINYSETFYFGIRTEQGYEKRFDTPEAIFILNIAGKTDKIINST